MRAAHSDAAFRRQQHLGLWESPASQLEIRSDIGRGRTILYRHVEAFCGQDERYWPQLDLRTTIKAYSGSEQGFQRGAT